MATAKKVQPMLASRVDMDRLYDLRFPLLVSPKFDGIRAIVKGGIVLSRTLKPIPSRFVQEMWGHSRFEGLDGELIFGDPTFKDCYRNTYSAVMTHGSSQAVNFFVFDLIENPNEHYHDRLAALREYYEGTSFTTVVDQYGANSWEQIEQIEQAMIDDGFEGIIIRDPHAHYKYGRSTFLEQALLKMKRFRDSEAVVEGVEELMRNQNEAVVDARGLTVRSSHQENLVGANILGALLVKDIRTGIDFKIGTGFDVKTREDLWRSHKEGHLVGTIVKYKYLDYGVHERPRHPVFLGFRAVEDR